MTKKIELLDTTLRDGAQGEGISFSIEDKINIVKALDNLGIPLIEAGNPGANPKDARFFKKIHGAELKNSRLVAFGSTRRKQSPVDQDPMLQALLEAETPVVAIFGKSWDLHVEHVIAASLDENIRMIRESIEYLRSFDKEVIFDAEHFFDGYKANEDYALLTIATAVKAGASRIVLCDTNGGSFPGEIAEIVQRIAASFDIILGIHCHNDCGMAVAATIMAVDSGARHVQGTVLGAGERCGNANLTTIIPNLQVKRQYQCVPHECLPMLTSTARYIAELSNVFMSSNMPYVGTSAFAHKAGMHADAVNKLPLTFEHIQPQAVGNERRFLMSEMSGRTAVLTKINKIAPRLSKDSPETNAIINKLKELERKGYQFEGAECSFELIIRKELGKYQPFFALERFQIFSEYPLPGEYSSSALIKVSVDGVSAITAAEGDGPVNALDRALRKALDGFYPNLRDTHLIDYKVRVLDPETATAAKVRVLISSTDGKMVWTTVGVSRDIIHASLNALIDSIEYKLILDIEKASRSS